MKIFIILALVTLAAADWKPKSREELTLARRNCAKNLNITADMKEKANRLEYADTDEIKEFVLCGGRVSELWNEEKGWMSDRIITLLQSESIMSTEEMKQIIDDCLDDNSQGSSLKDWSFRNFKCVVESKVKDSFLKIMKKIE